MLAPLPYLNSFWNARRWTRVIVISGFLFWGCAHLSKPSANPIFPPSSALTLLVSAPAQRTPPGGRHRVPRHQPNVAATDVHSHYSSRLFYDGSRSFPDLPAPNYNNHPSFRPHSPGHRLGQPQHSSHSYPPWSDLRDPERYQGEDFMSDQSRAPGPRHSWVAAATGASDEQHVVTSGPAASHPPDRYGSISTSSPAAQRTSSPYPAGGPSGPARTMELPPLPPPSNNRSSRNFSPSSRTAMVSSILNPAHPDDTPDSPDRRRKVPHMHSPGSSLPTLPSLATQAPEMPNHYSTTSPGPLARGFDERSSRKILTPKSPSLHRAASLNQLHQPVATISAQQAPFPPSPRTHAYSIEPGAAGAPLLPTPPANLRQAYGFPSRGSSVGASRPMGLASASASPRSSFSSYSQAEQASPAMGNHTLAPPHPGPTGMSTAMEPERQRSMGIPVSSSSGPNVYQMMALETTSGTVQVPVDVQAASRVADEKRRRNAGASARFRQRRKEKEKEASTTISRLEHQLKDVSEDMDFYKRERDYFAGVVLQTPGGERHFPRPQSPRVRRDSSTMAGPSGTNTASYASSTQDRTSQSHSPDNGRNGHYRNSTSSLPGPPRMSSNSMLGGPPTPGQSGRSAPQLYGGQPQQYHQQQQQQQQQFQPPPPPPHSRSQHHSPAGSFASPHRTGSLPPLAMDLPQLMQAAPQTGPRNPYATADRNANGVHPSQNHHR